MSPLFKSHIRSQGKSSFPKPIRRFLGWALALASLLLLSPAPAAEPVPANKPANYPAWWFERGVIPRLNPANSAPSYPVDYRTPDYYAVLNQAQLKVLATAAYFEFEEAFAALGGAGPAVFDVVKGWYQLDASGALILNPQTQRPVPKVPAADPYAVVNLGMLKAVAYPFYDRLFQLGYPAKLPWSGLPDDFALANLGQAKNLFNLDPRAFTIPLGGEPLTWRNLARCTTDGNDGGVYRDQATTTPNADWDASAISTRYLTGDGFIEVKFRRGTTNAVIGFAPAHQAVE